MSLTASDRERIRTARSTERKDATKRTPPAKTPDSRPPQTIIEAQVDALHFGLIELRRLVDSYAHQIANVRAELGDPNVTAKWLDAERHILILRQRVAALENAGAA